MINEASPGRRDQGLEGKTVGPEYQTALKAVMRKEGRRWKAALSRMWEKASYPGYDPITASNLQYLRNSSSFGPSGLRKWRPPQTETIS